MKHNPLEVAKTNKKNLVTFEVNDQGREYEFKAGPNYIEPFIGFLESLGLEPSQKYEHSSNVIIDGVEFGIDLDNASFMSKNIYKRTRFQRKPENRFIRLGKGWKSTVVRVYINKEMDADKIISKIEKAVLESKETNQRIDDRKRQDDDNTIKIGEFYSAIPLVKKNCSGIWIEKGVVSFHMNAGITINFKADGSFQSMNTYQKKCESLDQVPVVANELALALDIVKAMVLQIAQKGKLSDDLQSWSLTANHRRFDVQKKTLFKY